jgi:hypothetical protein
MVESWRFLSEPRNGRNSDRSQVRPAAQFEVMILNAFSLAQDGRVNRKGMPNFLQIVLFVREFSDVVRFTRPPSVVQSVLFGLVAPFARLLGYRGSYQEYLTRRHEHDIRARRPTLFTADRPPAPSLLETA